MGESERGMVGDGDGVFVVFEGIDGAGTTTQAERFAQHLRSARRLVHVTREPSTGPIGSLTRLVLSHRLTLSGSNQAEILTLLFAADRLDHIESEVLPHLRDGYAVLSDRYALSSVAYQSLKEVDGSDRQNQLVAWIRQANCHARIPDVTLILDVDPEVAAARRRARGGVRELYEDAELQMRLAKLYKEAQRLVPDENIVHVDGNGTVDEVAMLVIEALSPYFARAT